jgi:drug/metabolite transporter (DMT)-like permease
MMTSDPQKPPIDGALYGLAAAVLFGASMPLAKSLLADVHPFVLAGLFYLGSGVGLTTWLLISKARGGNAEAQIRRGDLGWLGCAILFGGVLAGLFLMWGLRQTPASGASLLLNLEGVFGAVIAWIVFREHANKRVVLGMVALTAGAMLLSIGATGTVQLSLGALAIVLACLCWGIDNNLTRKISGADPVQIAAAKGIVAGVVNIGIGLSSGGSLPSTALIATSMAVGFFSYGVSLVLYILGLRHVGAARTAAYFSAAPFIGAIASVVFLSEPITAPFVVAASLMVLGLWLHLTEEHDHEHTHSPLEHDHLHVHDEHHRHEHGPDDPPGEPHSHFHQHERITHTHPHMPDLHHVHSHDD